MSCSERQKMRPAAPKTSWESCQLSPVFGVWFLWCANERRKVRCHSHHSTTHPNLIHQCMPCAKIQKQLLSFFFWNERFLAHGLQLTTPSVFVSPDSTSSSLLFITAPGKKCSRQGQGEYCFRPREPSHDGQQKTYARGTSNGCAISSSTLAKQEW